MPTASAPVAEVSQSGGEAGLVGGAGGDEIPPEGDGFLGGGDGVSAAAHPAVVDAEIVQGQREAGR